MKQKLDFASITDRKSDDIPYYLKDLWHIAEAGSTVFIFNDYGSTSQVQLSLIITYYLAGL